MTEISNIVVLNGAGVSQESGLPTFRTMADGQMGWDTGICVHPVEDVATPEAFRRNPATVHAFYDGRRSRLDSVKPNAAHRALARLDAHWPGTFLLVTQNVDDLHERAGSTRLVHMHGELKKGWCLDCASRFPWEGEMGEQACCPVCAETGRVRPDIVWFGEMPYGMEQIDDALRKCDLFVSIGTSGAVYPAAGFVQTARYYGAATLEINLEPSLGSSLFDMSRRGPASTLVPQWVDELVGQSRAFSSRVTAVSKSRRKNVVD